jgi:hypothetical protein
MSLNRSSALVEKCGRHPSAVEAAPNYRAPTKERPRAPQTTRPPASRAQRPYRKLTWCQSGTCGRSRRQSRSVAKASAWCGGLRHICACS